MFLGLRKMEGISLATFENTFGKTMEACYGEQIHRLMKQGLLDRKDGHLMLTRKGIDVSNYVFGEFLI